VTRRKLLWTAGAATGAATLLGIETLRQTAPDEPPVIVPVRRVMNARARCTAAQYRAFWWSIWPQAVQEFARCGVRFETTDATGDIRHLADGRPAFMGLQRGVLNLFLTDYVPMYWDNGRGLSGVTTMLAGGYHLCLVAIAYAHGNLVPFVSVNTCVHEMLHALMQDIYVQHPGALQTGGREFRIDAYATELWVLHRGAAIRESARRYIERLRPDGPSQRNTGSLALV